MIEPRVLGVLDAPLSRSMTAEGGATLRSRGTHASELLQEPPSKSGEGAGNAGCALHPWPPVQKKAQASATKGTPQQPAFPAQWF
jgi:hypothetical protein